MLMMANIRTISRNCRYQPSARTASLAHAQSAAVEDGVDDKIALLPGTFDPEYDTPDRLAEYSQERGTDLDAGKWWFLRPETR